MTPDKIAAASGKAPEPVGRIFLRTGRDGPVRGGNPWIFSQAIARVEPVGLAAGALVEVRDSGGDLLGIGYYNSATTIAIRILAWGSAPALGGLIARRLGDAIAMRARFIRGDTDSYRLVNGDGDGLSGVVVDRYGDVLVLQLLTAGADAMRAEIISALAARISPRAIIERSQGAVRKQEGLADRIGVAYGVEVYETVATENGIKFPVDLARGQKTGAFLDQRENRAIVRGQSAGARVLDAYCYNAGFALAALAGGAARVVAIDTSVRALAAAEKSLALGGYPADAAQLIHGEAGEFMAKTDERFDVVVLDPPPLARSRADADRAGRLYVELNALAMRVLAPGGRILTFSCSAHFRGEEFLRAVRIAQNKSGRKLKLLARLGPGPDHPVLLGHAEGEYLTGLLLADLG
ncbi:MAG TPA: class I SAM-dependent rRNA methyltransferase [Candidatus Binataceae bacterium]|nr:class I SAM-dependent rRNA methyltransferase [Candidatus Binataceae bacterium]